MKLIEYKNKGILEDNLVIELVTIINNSIEKNGNVNILLSGGSTPKNLFQKLSQEKLDWKKVSVGLVDERFVSTESEKSNEKLIRENLLINKAKEAQFVGLIYDTKDRNININIANRMYHKFAERLDICLLGMGKDGHTASLFPKDEISKKELASSETHLLLNTEADILPFERITCSKHLIFKSENLILMITGEDKKEALFEAKEKNYPIATFFETPSTDLFVHYSKN